MGRPKKIVSEIEDKDEECKDKVTDLKYISTGSTNLNLALTNTLDGGYPVGKIINLVGDKQLGKSLLCIEAINYAYYKLRKKYDVRLVYDETEGALDTEMAEGIGFPTKHVEMKQSSTVEAWYKNLEKEIDSADNYDLVLYVLDSLDAISSEGELEEEFDKKTYNMAKQKQLSQLFRRLVIKLKKKNFVLIIVSQIRDKIGVTFGETKTRSGGKALDFYASQIVWLHNKGVAKNGNIAIGIDVKAKVKKNRAWKPFREVDFNILFGHGIDDLGSMVDYLLDNKYLPKTGNGRIQYEDNIYTKEAFIAFIYENKKEQEIKDAVKSTWDRIEEEAAVIRRPKYEEALDRACAANAITVASSNTQDDRSHLSKHINGN